MKYLTLYRDLASSLYNRGCSVGDHDLWGYCYHTKQNKAFIYIKSDMSYKNKFFCLAHEMGHLFYMKNGKSTWSKKPRTEEEANQFALQMLKRNDIDLDEYKAFYGKACRAVKKRKKSWFEL